MTDSLKTSLNRIEPLPTVGEARPKAVNSTSAAAFKEALSEVAANPAVKAQTTALASTDQLKFSNHAVERMQKRGITLSPEQREKMNVALQKATEKGAKETLMLTDDAAYIVSVKNKTVVTAMDKLSLKENVFTNIDSTIMI